MAQWGNLRLEKTEVIPLFPSFLWQTELKTDVYRALNKKVREALVELMADKPPLAPGAMFQTEQSLHQREEFRPLTDFIHTTVGEVLDHLKVTRQSHRLSACWANVGAPGSSHKAHLHPNNFLSGVYYVQAGEGARAICFYDPRPQIGVISPHTKKPNLATATEVHVPVSEGMLVIFPAWLQHRVDKNNSDAARISVSFNAVFDPLPTGGEDTAPGLRLVEE